MGFTDRASTSICRSCSPSFRCWSGPRPHAAAGFTAVELWWPWVDSPAPEQAELEALRAALNDAGRGWWA